MSNGIKNATYEQLYNRYTLALSQWLQYKPRLEESYEYTQPYRNKFYFDYGGERRGLEVFDPTAVSGVISFTSKLMNALTPINQQFMRLTAGPSVPDKFVAEVNKQLEFINDIIWRYIKKSNFSQAINESYFDVAVGTGVISTVYYSDDEPLVFAAHPLCEVFFEKTNTGAITNLWRQFVITGTDAIEIWPNAKVPQIIEENNTAAGSNVTFNYAEGTMIFTDTDGKKRFRTVVLCIDASEIVQDIISDSSPWTVYRWDVPPRETYGVGVATVAMPSIRTLNKQYEFLLRQGAFASAPPFEYNSNMPWNPYNTPLEPGLAIAVQDIGEHSGSSIRPINFGGNFEVSIDIITDLRNQINKILFSDPLGSIQEPVRTATEMMMRQQETVEAMGPRFARLAVEFLGSLLKRIVYILSKKGLIPALEIDGKIVDIEFEMPIAKSTGMKNITNILQIHAGLSQIMSPELASLSMSLEELPQYFVDQSGGDLRLVKSPEQIKQIMSKMMQGAKQNAESQQ